MREGETYIHLDMGWGEALEERLGLRDCLSFVKGPALTII